MGDGCLGVVFDSLKIAEGQPVVEHLTLLVDIIFLFKRPDSLFGPGDVTAFRKQLDIETQPVMAIPPTDDLLPDLDSLLGLLNGLLEIPLCPQHFGGQDVFKRSIRASRPFDTVGADAVIEHLESFTQFALIDGYEGQAVAPLRPQVPIAGVTEPLVACRSLGVLLPEEVRVAQIDQGRIEIRLYL